MRTVEAGTTEALAPYHAALYACVPFYKGAREIRLLPLYLPFSLFLSARTVRDLEINVYRLFNRERLLRDDATANDSIKVVLH